ncbi:hypothetical protein vBVpP1_49 [Vibrio phage vB_VpP_1]|nr:hypothetical protein vBVpP1_49 [Vibrio phage vB_VpP_1]
MLKRMARSLFAAVVMLICYLFFFIAFVWVTVKLCLTGRTFALDITYKTLSEVLAAS